MTRWKMPFQRELIEQRSRFDLPMSHHERQSCASTRLNHSCSCVATPFFNTIGQKRTSHSVCAMSALPPIADIRWYAGHRVFPCDGAKWSSSLAEEHDHACLREPHRSNPRAFSLEQGKADRGKTSFPAQARLVYPNQTAIGGTNTRP